MAYGYKAKGRDIEELYDVAKNNISTTSGEQYKVNGSPFTFGAYSKVYHAGWGPDYIIDPTSYKYKLNNTRTDFNDIGFAPKDTSIYLDKDTLFGSTTRITPAKVTLKKDTAEPYESSSHQSAYILTLQVEKDNRTHIVITGYTTGKTIYDGYGPRYILMRIVAPGGYGAAVSNYFIGSNTMFGGSSGGCAIVMLRADTAVKSYIITLGHCDKDPNVSIDPESLPASYNEYCLPSTLAISSSTGVFATVLAVSAGTQAWMLSKSRVDYNAAYDTLSRSYGSVFWFTNNKDTYSNFVRPIATKKHTSDTATPEYIEGIDGICGSDSTSDTIWSLDYMGNIDSVFVSNSLYERYGALYAEYSPVADPSEKAKCMKYSGGGYLPCGGYSFAGNGAIYTIEEDKSFSVGSVLAAGPGGGGLFISTDTQLYKTIPSSSRDAFIKGGDGQVDLYW